MIRIMRKILGKLKKMLRNKNLVKNLLLFLAGVFVLLTALVIVLLSSFKIPDFRSFEDRKVVNSTKIYDRTGKILLYDIHQETKRTDITSDKMGDNIKRATVAIEDSEFYSHHGIRITSTIRAVLSNIFGFGIGGGGSTITQQLVKNTLLRSEQGYARYIRKIKEWILAVKIDKSMSKDKILEYYLNEAPYGGNVYGIAEASKTYFDKDPIDLTIAEAAYLAAIPQSPTVLSPYGKNRDRLETRKNLVLSRMLQIKFISQAEYDAAKSEVVAFAPQAIGGIRAPHFVFFIKEYLEKKYGSAMTEVGGLRVTTTLDYELQEKGEQIVKEGAIQNEKDWNGENAGLVAIDPKTGQILTMVGSRNYFDKEIDGNYNIATAERQPGSSFKPFIYATAFNKGFTPNTVLFDLPTEFQSTCDAYGKALPGHNQSDCYMPDDYDGKFRGPMKLYDALAQSINIPAVQLFYLAGTSDSLKTAEEMGISTLGDIGRYGLTLVIGGGEVSLIDITSAYGTFANGGIRNPYTGILKVEDSAGKVLEEFDQTGVRGEEVLPKNTALTISKILSDEEAREPTFGIHSSLFIPNKDVAVKTGTTNNNKDAWTIGYTPSIAVGVWAGNNDNTPMKKGGAAVAGPIWNKFINEALKTLPDERFEEPDLDVDPTKVKPVLRGFWQGNENFFIDKISGKLATPNTPRETLEEKIVPNVHSILYWVDKKDILGPAPTNPAKDPQFNHFEIPLQNWWAKNKDNYPMVFVGNKPTEFDDIHTNSVKPVISITEPSTQKIYLPSQRVNLQVSSSGPYPLLKMEVFINNVYLGSLESPFIFTFYPSQLENLQAENEIKVVAYDTAYNSAEASVTFKVEQ